MRITIFAFGTWGDVRPFVVLGMGLQAAGHDVQVVASPGYEDWVRARGLDFHPLRDDVHRLVAQLSSRDVFNPIHQIQMVREVLPQILTRVGQDLLAAARAADALLTVEFSLAAFLDVLPPEPKTVLINPAPLTPTREFISAGAPSPQLFPFPAFYNRLSYSFVRRMAWMLLSTPRNQLRKQHPGKRKHTFNTYQAALDAAPALTVVSKHVITRPADWADHQQITGYLFDDDPTWTPPAALCDFLAAGEPPVYIGFGSMPDSKPQATTRLFIEALHKAGKRGVILSGWAGMGVDDAPENIHFLKYAPHNWLFPQMVAVVHHGGAGTTASGFLAGVPTIIVPHNADQPFWGRRAQELGVGTAPIPRGKLSVDKLAAAIVEATTNRSIHQKAAELSQKIDAEDGTGEAVKMIGAILDGSSPSRFG
ncbi:MAG: glycosyltransferase family 1 protein [Caldilineaceae bacterium]|nr:glycosyltransferase family 1 protein [Caldilineaceae bacterium]